MLPVLLKEARALVGPRRRVTVVFDRGGWSPKLFAKLIQARVVSLSGADVAAIIELTTLLQTHIESQISAEQARLLPIVRRLPLEQVLAGGQKAFVVDARAKVAERRKR